MSDYKERLRKEHWERFSQELGRVEKEEERIYGKLKLDMRSIEHRVLIAEEKILREEEESRSIPDFILDEIRERVRKIRAVEEERFKEEEERILKEEKDKILIEEEKTRFPTDISRIVASYSDPGVARALSLFNREVLFYESLDSIYKRFGKFINAVNNGDYDTVKNLLDIGFDIDLAQNLQRFFRFSSKNIRILELLSQRGMKLSSQNLFLTLMDATANMENTIGTIFRDYYSLEDLEWYVDILIQNHGLNRYLVDFAKLLAFITNLRLHIYFTEALLRFVDIIIISSSSVIYVDTINDLRTLLTALVIEASTLEGTVKTYDTEDVLNVIYDNIVKIGMRLLPRGVSKSNTMHMIIRYVPNYEQLPNLQKILGGIIVKLRENKII